MTNIETAAAVLEGEVPAQSAITALAAAMGSALPANADLPGQAAYLRRQLLVGLIRASAFGATL